MGIPGVVASAGLNYPPQPHTVFITLPYLNFLMRHKKADIVTTIGST